MAGRGGGSLWICLCVITFFSHGRRRGKKKEILPEKDGQVSIPEDGKVQPYIRVENKGPLTPNTFLAAGLIIIHHFPSSECIVCVYGHKHTHTQGVSALSLFQRQATHQCNYRHVWHQETSAATKQCVYTAFFSSFFFKDLSCLSCSKWLNNDRKQENRVNKHRGSSFRGRRNKEV